MEGAVFTWKAAACLSAVSFWQIFSILIHDTYLWNITFIHLYLLFHKALVLCRLECTKRGNILLLTRHPSSYPFYLLTACLPPLIADFDFASTRGNTLRFSSAEEESQTVAKSQTSCWRSRGWWARMRARGTSTFTIRSEADGGRAQIITDQSQPPKKLLTVLSIHYSQFIESNTFFLGVHFEKHHHPNFMLNCSLTCTVFFSW